MVHIDNANVINANNNEYEIGLLVTLSYYFDHILM